MPPESSALKADRLAGYTAVILIGLGIVQVVFGEFFSESVALVANGIDCIGDGFVSATVWAGLLYFQRPADDRFHFGYYKLENLASIVAAIVMFILAGYIFYRSYQQLVDPHPVTLPAIGIALALVAAIVALALGLYKKRAGRDSRLGSIKLEAFNTIKDGTASALTVVALLFSSAGFPVADAIVGFVIAGAIVSIGYISIKESSAMLVDACDSQCLLQSQVIKRITRGIDGIVDAEFIRLRRSGPVLQGELEVVVPRDMSIAEVYDVRQRILDRATEEVPELERLAITAIPADADAEEQSGAG
ncbi:MAG: cation diffusion facilitator family transporter [Thermoplasmatota archaeon]